MTMTSHAALVAVRSPNTRPLLVQLLRFVFVVCFWRRTRQLVFVRRSSRPLLLRMKDGGRRRRPLLLVVVLTSSLLKTTVVFVVVCVVVANGCCGVTCCCQRQSVGGASNARIRERARRSVASSCDREGDTRCW